MLGTSLKDIRNIKIIGESVLSKEIQYCKKIPETQRIIMSNHVMNPEGEGEPYDSEETIQENYDNTFGY